MYVIVCSCVSLVHFPKVSVLLTALRIVFLLSPMRTAVDAPVRVSPHREQHTLRYRCDSPVKTCVMSLIW